MSNTIMRESKLKKKKIYKNIPIPSQQFSSLKYIEFRI